MEQLIKQALKTLAKLGNSDQVALFSVEDNGVGVMAGGLNKGEFLLPGKRLEFKDTPLEKIISTKQAHTYPGTLVDSLPFPTYKETNNGLGCLCLPLLNDNTKLIGIALLSQKTASPLPTVQVQVLNLLRSLMAVILETAMETEHLIQMATTDSLTGLYSRRYFEGRLQEEFTRVRRHGGEMSVLLIDVDRFKQINETCGYPEGNRVLQELAKLISTTIRKEIDIPCRYGGEQFILLLPNTNVDGAYVLAERLRKRCEQQRFSTLKGIPLKVTISVGISHSMDIVHEEETSDNDEAVVPVAQVNLVTKEELLYRADTMLYAAKQAGRNQVMVWW